VPNPRSALPNRIVEAADRVYSRDPQRYHKLIVWVHYARGHNWSDERIIRALDALNKKLATGEQCTDWWPYLNRALAWIRTRELQKENDGYKTADLTSARAIMKKLFKDL
jgi:hypothetical protein